MSNAIERIRERLFAMQDEGYRAFHSRLIPTVDPSLVIGVRTPALRKYAKELAKTPDAQEFLQCLPHWYYEENNLHGFLIEQLRDYDQTIAALAVFLPFVDNWATCDLIRPRIFQKHLPELISQIPVWMASGQTYTVRFGIEMLMTFYLDAAFRPEYLDWVAELRSDEYYVNMMIAWFFATALAKQWDTTIPYIEGNRLDPWVHNKTIQKARESYRITEEQKEYLKGLKR